MWIRSDYKDSIWKVNTAGNQNSVDFVQTEMFNFPQN